MYLVSHTNDHSAKSISVMARRNIQAKLIINEPGDQYEREADAMAERVMGMSSNVVLQTPTTGLIGASVQRKCAHCEEEEKKHLMRKAENSNYSFHASPSFVASVNASAGGGSPLPQQTKSFMENAFSADFSKVRVHTDSQAAEMSRGINAKAFTHGSDIYFNNGQFTFENSEGKALLAHELTHVVQQNFAISRNDRIQRQNDRAEAQTVGSCYTCQIPGGVGVCCSSSDMPLVPECWDLATKIIDNCPSGNPSSCLTQAKCAQCQCVAAKMGERYCQCTGIV